MNEKQVILTDEFHHQAMALKTGDVAPGFNLRNANGDVGAPLMSFDDVAGERGTLLVFECNHCPYVVASVGRINDLAMACEEKGVGFAGINANDPLRYENDSFEHMTKRAQQGMPYAYLHDDTQETARAYGAKRTPEFYLFDANATLVYQGRMDDSPRHPGEVTTNELGDALSAMLAGEQPTIDYTESIGCSVKWKE